MVRIAVIDDYADMALEIADWSKVASRAEITVFNEPLDEDEAALALAPFDVICTMRERTRLTASLLERLPNLKLVTLVGFDIATVDVEAATRLGIALARTDIRASADKCNAPGEIAIGLMVNLCNDLIGQRDRVRAGKWGNKLGKSLRGQTLGLLGLGTQGKIVSRIANAMGMRVLAWSQNLTEEAAAAGGAQLVSKEALFAEADIVSLHVRISERTRGIVSEREISAMKSSAFFINTARGALVDEAALVEALRSGRIAGAGLDVYQFEPLPTDHPFRNLGNVIALPHIGYAVPELMEIFYGETIKALIAYLDDEPLDLANPEVLTR